MIVTDEKRRFRRVPFREPLQFKTVSAPHFTGSLAYDISEEGLRFQTDNFIPLQESLTMQLQLDAEKVLNLHGRVMWIQMVPHSDRYQIGVRFDDQEKVDNSKRAIQDYIQTRQSS